MSLEHIDPDNGSIDNGSHYLAIDQSHDTGDRGILGDQNITFGRFGLHLELELDRLVDAKVLRIQH